jgi:hypothetical protein
MNVGVTSLRHPGQLSSTWSLGEWTVNTFGPSFPRHVEGRDGNQAEGEPKKVNQQCGITSDPRNHLRLDPHIHHRYIIYGVHTWCIREQTSVLRRP